MRARLATLLLIVLTSAGCRGGSRLAPEEALGHLDDAEVAQLCRFTVDVWQGEVPACDGPGAPLEADACRSAPPWPSCPTEGPTVADWEDCVYARLDDPCAEPTSCARVPCP